MSEEKELFTMQEKPAEQSTTLLKNFLKLALPTTISIFILTLPLVTNIYFAGHLNDTNMIAGVGLATTA